MGVGMSASITLLVWALLTGVFMWRLAPRLEADAAV
jgi:hypothetical protein